MQITQSQWLAGLFVFSLLGLGFQSCGKFRPIDSGSDSSSSSSLTFPDGDRAAQSLIRSNIVQDCWNDNKYNACVFWKNPVAQEGGSFSNQISGNTNLRAYQKHAVNISGYDGSGQLRNPSMTVLSYNENTGREESLSTRSGNFKYAYAGDRQHRISQVMAYHWMMTLGAYMHYVTGGFYAGDRGIDVVAYSPDEEVKNNAYWNKDENRIIIGESSSNGQEFSLSAEIYAHEAGHANIHYATGGAIYETPNRFATISCVSSGGTRMQCCRSSNGCSWAIDEGQADYHYAVLFPNNTALLETFANHTLGVTECGRYRSLDENINLTAVQAYNACDPRGAVHVMGRVYASTWWVVRKQVATAEGSPKNIDVLFSAHIAALEGRDDFRTALDKIIATDRALFNGKYSSYFTREFARRGIF